MELFYSDNFINGICTLNEEESKHCTKVLRHVVADVIHVIDGAGGLYECKIMECRREVVCRVISSDQNWGCHSYHLTMAVAPTKNMDRYEWFLEKATEIGIDKIVPVIGEYSQRKIVKPERFCKILVSAAKQSLKAAIPLLAPEESVISFIKEHAQTSALKLIAYCGETQKESLQKVLLEYKDMQNKTAALQNQLELPQIMILIGPEGDFSPKEVELAFEAGFKPIHLGTSRLRTETAAIAAVSCVYFNY
ncbi:MAG: RsmE family RNA methyltransferase [Bacteroidales bacterium]